MLYNSFMSENNKTTKKPNEYTEEEIKNMTYWELWGLRRTAGMSYYMMLLSIYSFLLYLFFKVVYKFATKSFDNFSVDWWAILLCLGIALIYWFFHEWYYKNIFLKKKKTD